MNGRRLADHHIVLTSRETLISGPVRQLWRCLTRRCLPFLVCISLVGYVGCVVLPTPEHTLLEGRGEIDESEIAFLSVGKTTREEVLLRFGEPDLILHDQNILIYHWRVSHGYYLVYGGAGPIPKDYLFMLEFDGEGYLTRFEIGGSIWTSAESRIVKWSTPVGEKLPSKNREIIMIDPIPKANSQPGLFGTPTKPIRFWIGKFRHLQANSKTGTLIGHKNTASGVISANVLTARPAIEIVRAAVACQLEALGHQFASKDADVTITGEIAEFGVTTSLKLSTWDAIGSLDVIIEVQPAVETRPKIIRRYKAKHVLRMRFTPSKANLEQVMRTCLEDMQKQMASDAELARLLGGRTQ
jgi:hypothetical protein